MRRTRRYAADADMKFCVPINPEIEDDGGLGLVLTFGEIVALGGMLCRAIPKIRVQLPDLDQR